MPLNSSQQATYEAVLEVPVRSDIRWAAIESMFIALGATLREGNGSRVRVTLKNRRATFHRPHPRRVAGRLTVRDVRAFLHAAGVIE